MRISICLLFFVFCLLSSSCGSGALTKLLGPDLGISELSAIRVDQLKFTGGLSDDNDGVPEPALYIRCANSDIDMVCSGRANGLDIVKKDGVIYGGLSAKFEAVDGVTSGECFDVRVLFVEKDSGDCPAPISPDDDIVWTSQVLTVNEEGLGSLLSSNIGDGNMLAYLITEGDEPAEDLILATPPQTENILKLDQLFFEDSAIDKASPNFKLVVKDDDNKFRCEAAFSKSSAGIGHSGVIYGNLGIALLDAAGGECLVNDENKLTSVTVSLYISGIDEPLAMKESTTITDLVDNDGGKENLGENAYIRFVPIEGF